MIAFNPDCFLSADFQRFVKNKPHLFNNPRIVMAFKEVSVSGALSGLDVIFYDLNKMEPEGWNFANAKHISSYIEKHNIDVSNFPEIDQHTLIDIEDGYDDPSELNKSLFDPKRFNASVFQDFIANNRYLFNNSRIVMVFEEMSNPNGAPGLDAAFYDLTDVAPEEFSFSNPESTLFYAKDHGLDVFDFPEIDRCTLIAMDEVPDESQDKSSTSLQQDDLAYVLELYRCQQNIIDRKALEYGWDLHELAERLLNIYKSPLLSVIFEESDDTYLTDFFQDDDIMSEFLKTNGDEKELRILEATFTLYMSANNRSVKEAVRNKYYRYTEPLTDDDRKISLAVNENMGYEDSCFYSASYNFDREQYETTVTDGDVYITTVTKCPLDAALEDFKNYDYGWAIELPRVEDDIFAKIDETGDLDIDLPDNMYLKGQKSTNRPNRYVISKIGSNGLETIPAKTSTQAFEQFNKILVVDTGFEVSKVAVNEAFRSNENFVLDKPGYFVAITKVSKGGSALNTSDIQILAKVGDTTYMVTGVYDNG